ncbi:hypothetical protein Vafri_10899 [Volvox africanus]|uniref:ENTH domain-containing protein n=1 Tax=Volvox africanus TaxID=51714 RepID=A0A8J4B6W6_9CHLO|nr:hypothetical protein Vafri_10899 [Volvox africanus]
MNINFNSVLNSLAAKAKALALNVTDIELKVLEATNEEPWGPHGKDMQEIARAAEEPDKYNLIMNVISERLQMRDENWRLCYKALLLMEYLVKHGPWRTVEELARSVSSLERLRDDFEYKDAQGRDHGINVRQRAGELAALVCNTERVRQEREKAARNANKFKGVSSSDMRGGFGSTNYGSSSSGGGGGGGYGYGGFGGGGFGGGGGGGFQSQGFGSTESVHKPNSLHNRTGSGSNHSAGTGPSGRREEGGGFRTAGGGGEEAEDPFEATRKRIERLKAEGALQEPPAAGAPPGLVDPASASAKIPKKLSDVKINPAVAATFASISIPSSNSAGNLVKLAPPPSGKPSASSSHQQQHNVNNNDNSGFASLDLFAEQPSNLQTTQGNLQHQGVSATSAGLEDPWDAAFGTAASSGASALGTAAAQDAFADFTSAAPAAVVAPAAASPGADFNSLLGGGMSSTGPGTSVSTSATGITNLSAAAPPAKQPVRAALPFDAFSELSDPGPAPISSHITVGLSSRSVTTYAVTSPDPFAAIASSSSSASLAPPKGAATFRPAPAAGGTASDPFSALSASPAHVMTTQSAAKPKPAQATSAPLPADLFTAAATPPVPTPQPAAPAASDPFAALASSSTPAPIPMVALARPAAHPHPAAAAAAPFDPFSSAPAQPSVLSKPAAATPAFDAFGAMAAAPPRPAAPAAGSFDAFFGTSSPGQNGHLVSAPKTPGVTTAAAASAIGAPFTTSSFLAFATPPPPQQQQATATVPPTIAAAQVVSAKGTQMAMNKSGAAHGPAGPKTHDPFAGLGF